MASQQRDSGATTIAHGARVRGQVSGAEDVVVDGRIDGGIKLEGSLHVREGGVVVAQVAALDVHIAGILVGDVIANGAVTIAPKGKLVGDVKAGRIVIAVGGAMRGHVDTTEEATGAARGRSRASEPRDARDLRETRDLRDAFSSPSRPVERAESAAPAPPRPAMVGKKKLTRKA